MYPLYRPVSSVFYEVGIDKTPLASTPLAPKGSVYNTSYNVSCPAHPGHQAKESLFNSEKNFAAPSKTDRTTIDCHTSCAPHPKQKQQYIVL
jgi:hypothetical protein